MVNPLESLVYKNVKLKEWTISPIVVVRRTVNIPNFTCWINFIHVHKPCFTYQLSATHEVPLPETYDPVLCENLYTLSFNFFQPPFITVNGGSQYSRTNFLCPPYSSSLGDLQYNWYQLLLYTVLLTIYSSKIHKSGVFLLCIHSIMYIIYRTKSVGCYISI